MKIPIYWKKPLTVQEGYFVTGKHNPHISKDVAGKGVSHTILWYFQHCQGDNTSAGKSMILFTIVMSASIVDFNMAKPKGSKRTVYKTQKKYIKIIRLIRKKITTELRKPNAQLQSYYNVAYIKKSWSKERVGEQREKIRQLIIKSKD